MKATKTKSGIFYLYDYYPTRYKDFHQGISEKIIEFKSGKTGAIDYFCRIMKSTLDEMFGDNIAGLSEYTVCIMPSHDKGVYSLGLRVLAEFLIDTYGMEDGIQVVHRLKTHDRNSNGGDRSIAGQIETLGICDSFDVKGKKILLLDDVTTTGNSIFAVKKLLEDHGNKWFVPFVLGKTTYPFPEQYMPEISEGDLLGSEKIESGEKIEQEVIHSELSILGSVSLEKTDITNWNIEEIKHQLEEALSAYKNIAYTDTNIKVAKKDKADLNKAKKIIEDARKAYRKQCLEPYNAIEPHIVELTNMIEVQRIAIDEVIKEYEIKRIEKKEEKIRACYEKLSAPLGEYADALYPRLRNPKWFNVTTDKRHYEESISLAIEETAKDIRAIKELKSPFYETIIEKYINTLSLQQAVQKHEELLRAAQMAGLSGDVSRDASQEIEGEDNKSDIREINLCIYADEIQYDKIIKYIESIGAKCIAK